MRVAHSLGVVVCAAALSLGLGVSGCAPAQSAAEHTESKAPEETTATVADEPAPASASNQAPTSEEPASQESVSQDATAPGLLSDSAEIGLRVIGEYGYETYYAFDYGEEEFTACCQPDVWTVFDSYKITNRDDMAIICQALSDEYPIHGSDYASYRTVEDMVFEWEQHNLVYQSLPEGSSWRESAKDVDFDPSDQGKTYKEIYEDRTGRELNISDLLQE